MRIKSVSGLNGNEVLAEPILTNENVVLIPKGTVLKEEYIPLIQSLEIKTLMVEDPYEHMETPNTIIDRISLNRIIERVKKIMENHIYHSNKSLREFEMIANESVKVMNEMPMDFIIDMDEHTANLYEHTVMVTLLSVMVAKKLKLDKNKRYNIAIGCLLHDIGITYITVSYENRDFSEADQADIFEFKKHTKTY